MTCDSSLSVPGSYWSEFLNPEELNPVEICRRMHGVYGDHLMSASFVKKSCRDEQADVHDESHELGGDFLEEGIKMSALLGQVYGCR